MASNGANVIIGIDTVNARVKMLTVMGTAYQRAEIEYFDFDRKLIDSGDYVSALDSVFASYDMSKLQGTNVHIVLPNNLVAFDYVGVPTMSKNKMLDAVRVEFQALYKNHESLQMIPQPINSSKRNALYILLMANRAMVNGMAQVFTTKKIPVKVKTFEGNALVNAALQLRSKARRSNFIFVDIKEDYTSIAVVNKERTVGFQNLPYGYSILSRSEVNNEQMLIDHDVAELAVLNATELARKKKLTIDAAEAEEAEEEARRAEEEAARLAAEEAAKQAEGEVEQKSESQLVQEQEQQAVDAEFADYNDEAPKVEEVKKPAVKVFAKKVPKALPMFMQRPIPETEEGFILENFRIFEKRILLLKKHCEYDQIMPTPDFIFINMPQEFAFIVDALNEDEDNGIEFRYFSPETENAPAVTENLDLLGAAFAGTWNRFNNF